MDNVFKEEQKFTQWWFWVLLIGMTLLPIYEIISQWNVKEQDISDNGQITFVLFSFGLIILFLFLRLKTKIDSNEIKISYRPFLTKRIAWKDVETAKVISYGFVGGWGIRLWTKYGTVYNTKGKVGLALVLKNGKKLLVGTQKEDELKESINSIMNLLNQ